VSDARAYCNRGVSPISLPEIMSDWTATRSTISAITGLDMTMPGDIVSVTMPDDVIIVVRDGDSYFGGNLTAYVNNGTIPEARVDDMAVRHVFRVLCCNVFSSSHTIPAESSLDGTSLVKIPDSQRPTSTLGTHWTTPGINISTSETTTGKSFARSPLPASSS